MNIMYLIDFNCPFSYIGIKRIQKAIKNLNLEVNWEIKSFELEPLSGKASIGAVERYAEKFQISQNEAEDKIIKIEKIAAEDGLEINFKDMTLRSSKDAHRLCKFVQSKYPDVTLELVEKIFYANFTENKNIMDYKTLENLAVSCGIDKSDVERILKNNYYNIEAELDKEEALSHGITSTPYFILIIKEEKLIIPGVFSIEEFETALKDFKEGNIKSKSYGIGALNQY